MNKEIAETPKVLVVDDQPANITAMQTILKSLDAEIHTASSGNEALSLMLRNKYSVVLADVQMPEMDGFELASLMRQNPDTLYTPVVFVTAISKDMEHVHRGYDVGAIDYLFKPIDKHVLLSKVSVFLQLYEQISDLEKSIYYYKRFMQKNAAAAEPGVPLANTDFEEPNEIPKVLVVDDRDENLLSMETVLKKLPIDIITANSGKKALELLSNEVFCLVLLDVQMPEMDGFEVAEKIRESKRGATTPIIFVTAINKDDKHIFKGYKTGAVDYLFKPIDSAVLVSKVIVFTQLYEHRYQLQRLLHEKNGLLYKIKKQNVQLGYLAYHDPLTMSSNRAGFERALEKTLEAARRYKRNFSVLLIDLDRFKVINDSYGHEYGDILLQEVAKRLQNTVRKTDFVARIGGDEFAVILEEINHFHDAGEVADHIITSLSETFSIKNNELRIGASIGIACFPTETGQTDCTKKSLVKNADIAMFRAKRFNGSAYEYFTDEFSKLHQERMIIENGLKFALERNEFFLVYQPKVDMQTRKLIGVETLLRWQHPEKGLISPVEFIPIAESTQMILSIGQWVIHESLKQISELTTKLNRSIPISINVSPHQLVNSNLLEIVSQAATEFSISPKDIELELTETAVMEELTKVNSLLVKLHALGFVCSIDDFGTGYSMLSYLKQLPVQTLKIDIDFVRDLGKDESNGMIINAIIGLANSFRLNVIAEGVETTEQEQFLLASGCKYAQGYLYSKPLTIDELAEFIQ